MCSIPQHKNNWGNDPELTDKSVSANIERIRILRNEWYGHATDFSLSDSDFEQRWNHISQIVKELEGYLGTATKYQDTLIELKSCCMDPDSIQPYIDKLLAVEGLQTDVTNLKEGFGELQTDVTNLKEGFGELQTDVTNLKEDVEEIKKTNEKYSTQESRIEKAIFDQWKQDDIDFISTKACKEVEKNIKSRNLVIVAGHSGSGKSAIIQHISLQYREQDWTLFFRSVLQWFNRIV
uniref:DZIP3-like HEPN domain-containing protein n=1 Tax=Magallana gigas TaxID=29159 RepID=A0A8W8IKW1_MAGGI